VTERFSDLTPILSGDWSPVVAPYPLEAYQCGKLRVIVSVEQHSDGRWLHVSISRADRLPSWDELKRVKADFMGDRWAVQFLPPASHYVNEHPNCLHLWHNLDETPSFFSGDGRRS